MAVNAKAELYEVVEVDGKMCLFTNLRVDRNSVPEGLFCYDIRDSDDLDGSFAQIKKHVMVNHWGTILAKEEFPLDETGAYYPKEEENYLGITISLEAYCAMEVNEQKEEESDITMHQLMQ